MKCVCILLIVAANVYAIPGPYVLTNLATPGGSSAPGGLDEAGQVAGTSYLYDGLGQVIGSTEADGGGLLSKNGRTRLLGSLGQNSTMPEPATACLFLVAAAVGLCRHPRQRGSRRVPHVRKLIRNCMARRKLSRPLPVTR